MARVRVMTWSLVRNLLVAVLIWLAILVAAGALGGVGTVELSLWLVGLVVTLVVIVVRHSRTRARTPSTI